MEFVRVNKSFCEYLFKSEIDLNHDVYILKNENIVGYGIIKDGKKNTIYFHVLEEYRGNGYGTILFGNLLNVVKQKTNFKNIEFTTSADDVLLNRIIKRFGGVEVFFEDGKVSYILPLDK